MTATFRCPLNADNLSYHVDGSVGADNQTGGTVTIRSITMDTKVTGIKGNWGNEALGRTSTSDISPFSPKTVNAGSKATIKFTTVWTCSDPGTGNAGLYADFAITLTLDTSAGKLKIGANKHRLEMT
ncbi:MAG TPA: hypothetical protein VFL27_03115 [Candidatus Dormibacteraeota bacterium]|nr:hypothetical protein [Candidatus Dormibacteraeota bacterium]